MAKKGKRGEAADRFERWRGNALLFVMEVFDMDRFGGRPGHSLDRWQEKALILLPTCPELALAACKGPGKSTFLAWAGWWLLTCHVNAQGAALSITKDNLRDNLWKELSLWHQRSVNGLLSAMFSVGKSRIESKVQPDTWFLSARSIPADADPEQQANALAGLHSDVVFILLDEAGDMPTGVIGAAKGIFTVVDQKGWLLVAGNRTSRDGALYFIESEDAEGWVIETITGDPDDPDRSTRIDIDNARAEIAKRGREHPWVKVNILGEYPPSGSQQRIDLDKVEAAMKRDVPFLAYRRDARIWGVDPAYSDRSGADEATLARRQGALCRTFTEGDNELVWRGLDGPQLANAIGSLIMEAEKNGERPDKIFVDKGGVGTSCYDHLKLLGWENIIIGVDFGGSASDPVRYYDKRSEMWDEMADWVESPASCLPNDPVLKSELISPRSGPEKKGNHTVFKLESKKDMRKRGKRSPNRADALALTFAEPVMSLSAEERIRVDVRHVNKAKTDYDIWDTERLN